jgi:hypothetical protein
VARTRVVFGSLVVAGALALAACSSDGGNDATAPSKSDDAAAAPATTAPTDSDSAALCAIFHRLAASGAGPGAQFNETTPEGWERRIATNAEMVEAAPPEWRDEAETYLQMVKDRAQLAAENGYVGVNDLPADVRTAFISSHRAMQAEVNELIAYMGQECGARKA